MPQLRSARIAGRHWIDECARKALWLVVCVVSPLTFATSLAHACVPGDFCHPPEVPADCNYYICRAIGGGTCWLDRLIICDDGDPCTVNACVNSQCVYTPIPDGQPCQGPPDNNRCLVGGTCQSGACTDKVPAQCNDNNPCTTDSCDPVTGCTYTLISCDDGNECTTDTCVSQTGACSHAPRPGGGRCDDNNPCTFDDICTTNANGEFVCLGSSACPSDNNLCTDDIPDPDSCECLHPAHDCSDGIACTTDTCSAATGCAHQPHAAAQAVAVAFGSNQTATWGATSDATIWNTYRGTIPAALMGSRPSGAYDHTCFESADAFGDGATLTTDAAIPPPGSGYYYFVSGENPCGESALGSGDSGVGGGPTPVPNPAPCPTPP
jgi:hypothetical protein